MHAKLFIAIAVQVSWVHVVTPIPDSLDSFAAASLLCAVSPLVQLGNQMINVNSLGRYRISSDQVF